MTGSGINAIEQAKHDSEHLKHYEELIKENVLLVDKKILEIPQDFKWRKSSTLQGILSDDHKIQEKILYLIYQNMTKNLLALIIENKSLQNINFMRFNQWQNLLEIYIGKNNLQSIDILNQYQQLKVIDAHENQIVKVHLWTQKLVVLNLQSNLIVNFPQFENLQQLKILNLSQNRIENFDYFDVEMTLNLQDLQLNNNKIGFPSVNKFKNDLLEKLRQLQSLKNLQLQNNPMYQRKNLEFFEKEKTAARKLILYNCKNIQNLDLKTKEQLQKRYNDPNFNQLNFAEPTDPQDEINEQNLAELKTKKHKKQQSESLKSLSMGFNIKPPPPLEELIHEIEQANLSIDAEAEIEILINYCEDIISQMEMFVLLFYKESEVQPKHIKTDLDKALYEKFIKQKEPLIENFLQNSVLIIDNQPKLRKKMLKILAMLAFVPIKELGPKCFLTLTEQIKSSSEMEIIVLDVIKNEIINQILESNPLKLNKFLIEDLRNLIRKNENYSFILDSFFKYCFPKWIQIYYQIVINLKNAQQEKKGDDEIYDLILNLLALSLRNENNLILFLEKGLNKYVSEIFNGTERHHNRYIFCLNIIKSLSNYKRKITDIFIIDDINTKIIDSIKKQIITLQNNQLETKMHEQRKKNESQGFLVDENTKDSEEQNLIFKHFQNMQIQAAEIETFGSLFHSSKQQQQNLIEQNKSVILQIFDIFQADNADPILLKGVCAMALNFFQCFTTEQKSFDDQQLAKEQKNQIEQKMWPFVEKLNGFKKLLSYIGGTNFTNLLVQTRRYQKAQIKTGNLIFSIDLVDQSIINELKKHDKEVRKENDINIQNRNDFVQLSLRKLKSVIINDLYYQIIYLVKFFTYHGCNGTNKHFIDINAKLNQNNRDFAIFSAIEIKNNKLRIACVDCLFDVQLDDLQENEVQLILFVLQNTNNINNGEIQIVLSQIFLVLTKFVLADYNKIRISKIFQKLYGQSSIDLGLEFLKIVLSKIVQEEDIEKERQKFQLSLSLINFLKAASNSDLMIQFFQGKKEIFKQILLNEDRYSSIQIKDVPINIENTIIGRDIISCIECLTGTDILQPYGDVSLRIIIRIADIMMNNQKFFFCKINDPGIKDPIKVIKQFQIEAYKMRKSKESSYWVDISNLFFLQMKKQDKEYLSNQHYNFTYSNGVALMLNFLTKKSVDASEMLEAICDPDFDSKLSKINSSKNKLKKNFEELENYKKRLEDKFIHQYVGKDIFQKDMFKLDNTITYKIKSELKKSLQSIQPLQNNQQQKQNDIKCTDSNKSKFNSNFQYEEYGQDFSSSIYCAGQSGNQKLNNEKIIEDLHIKQSLKINNDNYQQQMLLKRNDGFQNFELRVLTIAAFLRCLNASIEYAPTYSLKKRAIQNIKDPISFRCITQLCDSTDWDEEKNIGSKYMHIMRQLIKLSINQEKEDFDHMIYYNIIAIVIKRIVMKMRAKVLQNAQLLERDYITNYETCMTFFIILQQTNYFIFSEMDIVRVQRENQLKIEMFDKNTQQKISKTNIEQAGGYFTENFNQSQLKLKCENNTGVYQNMVRLRQKRSVQAKLVEHFILQLLDKQSIDQFIDSFFIQMKQEQKVFEDVYQQKIKNDNSVLSNDQNDFLSNQDIDEQQKNEIQIDQESSDSKVPQSKDEDINLLGDQKQKVYQTIEFFIDLKTNLTINKIKDIIGLLIAFCPKKFKYEIIEQIIKKCTLQNQIFRKSFIQEINDSARDNQFELNMQKYLLQNNFSCETWGMFGNQNYKPERILCLCYSDLNHIVAEIEGLEDLVIYDQQHKKYLYDKFDDIQMQKFVDEQVKLINQSNFVKRLFVLTNNGIQILKDIPENLKCKKCPVYQFCPRGPSQDFCIRLKDIETIILFSQVPQKIVIKYKTEIFMPNQGKKIGNCHYQITLNMPTLRAATKIKKELQAVFLACAEQIEIQKQKNLNNFDKKLQQEKKLDQSYVDILVQNELKRLIYKITGKDFTKDEKVFLDFQFVHLFSTNFVSQAFFNQVIRTNIETNKNIRQFGSEVITDQLYIQNQDKSIFVNYSLVGVYSGYIIILKEKWHNWKFIENQEDLEAFFQKLNDKSLIDQQDECKDKDLLYNYYPENDFQKQMMKFCISIKSNLFTPVICYKMDRKNDDFQIKISKGIYSSVEMSFKEEFKIQIIFTSDMIRQKFVKSIWDWYNTFDDKTNDLSEYGSKNQDRVQQQFNEFEEEDIDPIIYE